MYMFEFCALIEACKQDTAHAHARHRVLIILIDVTVS